MSKDEIREEILNWACCGNHSRAMAKLLEQYERLQWREGWLNGRAMSLRLLRLELTVMRGLSRETVTELIDAMMAGVERDKERGHGQSQE